MLPTKETNHTQEALKMLTEAFKNAANTKALLSALCNRCDELETAIWDVISSRQLANATGAQLDGLGSIVNERRQGRTDVDYVAAIRLRIRVNRTKGRATDIIEVAMLALPGVAVTYRESYPAKFTVTTLDVTGVKSVVSALTKTRAAGVYGCLHYSTWVPSRNFVFGSRTGFAGTGLSHAGTTGNRVYIASAPLT
jgi:hypothetical protein